MDHPTRDLYANFPVIHTGPQACLYTEKIQVILEIFHDIVLKSVACVLISNKNLMQIKQSSEKPIYNTDFDIQRARWEFFKYFWLISLQKKNHFNQVLYSPQKVSFTETTQWNLQFLLTLF